MAFVKRLKCFKIFFTSNLINVKMLCVTRVVVLAGEEVSSRFAGAELGLEILREKHDKTADD